MQAFLLSKCHISTCKVSKMQVLSVSYELRILSIRIANTTKRYTLYPSSEKWEFLRYGINEQYEHMNVILFLEAIPLQKLRSHSTAWMDIIENLLIVRNISRTGRRRHLQAINEHSGYQFQIMGYYIFLICIRRE